MTEQTEIAKQLGISMKALHRILRLAKIEDQFQLINQKRHYDLSVVLKAIQRGRDN